MSTRLLALTMFTICAAPLIAQDYFPLTVGNRWEYSLDGNPSHRIVEVTGSEQAGGKLWYRVKGLDASDTLLRLEGSSKLLAWDSKTEQEILRVIFDSPPGTPYKVTHALCSDQANTVRRDNGDVEIHYRSVCADAGLVHEIYRTSIGLKEWTTESFVGLRTWKLISARIAGQELSF